MSISLIALLLACGSSESEQPPVLGFEGLGEVRYEMDRPTAETALGHDLYGEESPDCHFLSPRPDGARAAVSLMFDGGTLRRIDVKGPTVIAEGGGHVGMTADEIRSLYRLRLTEQPRPDGRGSLLVVARIEPSEAKLIFETNPAGRVIAMRAGLPPQIDRMEGCY